MIHRHISQHIYARMHKGKAIIVYGPRQSGKTTFVKELLAKKNIVYLHINGDEPDARELLADKTSSALKGILGNHKTLFIDEAQRIKNIGLTIKLIVDNIPDVQVIATGSSAFELSDEIKEPLTGRKYEYNLYPLSYGEMVTEHGLLEEKRMLEQRMIFGYYPEIVTTPGEEQELLELLSDSYLYKDLLYIDSIKKTYLLEKIVKALALQVGSEVNYNELGQLVQADNQTIERYIDMLEKAFVIFRLPAYSKNVRNEIKKGKKFYFYDNGVRNAVIGNFNYLHQRTDVGALWENFIIAERRKFLSEHRIRSKQYFWRTTQRQEIDYIEEKGTEIKAFEFKWNPKTKFRFTKVFTNAYPDAELKKITPDEIHEFLLV